MKIKTKITIGLILYLIIAVIPLLLTDSIDSNLLRYATSVLWALVAPIIIGALIAIYVYERKEEKSGKKPTAQELQALAEEKEMKELMKKERNRKKVEAYKIKKMGSWILLPIILSFIVAIISGIMAYGDNWNGGGEETFFGIAFGYLFLWFFTLYIEEKWEKRLSCKITIKNEKELPYEYDFNYPEPDYIYTDSHIAFYYYNLIKIISVIISVVFIIGLILLGFMWLGSITIAPTTIIIILLIIIIVNQNKGRD